MGKRSKMIKVFVDTNIIFAFRKAYIANNFFLDATTFANDPTVSRIISRYSAYEMI